MFFNITKAEHAQLLKNGQASIDTPGGVDHIPIVKLFTPNSQCTWLISELCPDEPTRAFGLCDLGMGFPELGYVSMQELKEVCENSHRVTIEKDHHFIGTKPLSKYAKEARKHQRILV